MTGAWKTNSQKGDKAAEGRKCCYVAGDKSRGGWWYRERGRRGQGMRGEQGDVAESMRGAKSAKFPR